MVGWPHQPQQSAQQAQQEWARLVSRQQTLHPALFAQQAAQPTQQAHQERVLRLMSRQVFKVFPS